MKRTLKGMLVLAWAFALGCGDDTKIDLPSDDGRSSNGVIGIGDDGADASSPVASCDGAEPGTPCGKRGQEMHCIFDACVKNACGDGFPAYSEECDDGDEIDGDGCSSRCRLEVAPGCGNGVLEPGEQCDDGNAEEGDACTAACTHPKCGDGVVSRGEECDDGNVGNGDACTSRCRKPPVLCGNGVVDADEECDDRNIVDGDGCQGDCTLPPVCGDGDKEGDEECDDGNTSDGDSCASDCTLPVAGGSGGSGAGSGGTGAGSGGTGAGSGGTGAGTGGAEDGGEDEDAGMSDGGSGNPGCHDCREANCHAYFAGAMDAVSGCFDAGASGAAARAAWASTVFTPAQVQACVDAVACAEMKHCGVDVNRAAADCYCGSLYSDNGDCNAAPQSGAKAPNGACKAEFEHAAEDTSPTVVMTNLSSTEVPAGWAYFLLQCEATFCPDECSP